MFVFLYARSRRIKQFQVEDFGGKIKKKYFHMNDPRQYRKAQKILKPMLPPKRPRRPGRKRQPRDRSLWEWFYRTTLPQWKVGSLLRFRHATPPLPLPAEAVLTPRELASYQDLPEFDGFFDDIIRLNDFDFFDRAETWLAAQGVRLGAPFARDLFTYELARIQTGHRSYEGFVRNLFFFSPACLSPLLRAPQFVPSRQDFARFFRALPAGILEWYFYALLEELEEKRLVSYRVLLWDSQFVHSNSSDYKDKETGTYSDPEAGLCVHDNKFLGVGYKVSTLYAYCGERVVPVFSTAFPGNEAECDCFRATLEGYFAAGLPIPVVVIADSGGYSEANLEYVAGREVIPLVNARANITSQPVKKFGEHHYFNVKYLPACWSDDDVRKLYAVRTAIERCFSRVVVVYNAKRLSIRGLAGVMKHRWVILILDLLKILTSYKVGRVSLFQRPTAFARTREGFPSALLRHLYAAEGYKLLPGNEAEDFGTPKKRDNRGVAGANL